MAFNDLPQIDPPSEHDDEAQNRLERILNQKSGFLSRRQVPDKGCDYLVELIKQRKATHQHFAVQLKSVEKASLIHDDQIITFSWLTSRLSYLLKNAPIYGILVIYDVSSETLYYEHVEKIYNRLMERDSDDWKKNERVSVHVPIDNVLNESSTRGLHEVFSKRFENLGRMTSDHADSYDLPRIKTGFSTGYNLDKIEDVIEILSRWGVSAILINDIPLIFDLLSKLPNNQIVQRKELLILASLAYSEVGKTADSQFYIGRLRKKFELSPGENQMIAFIELKNDFSLGEISVEDFVEKIDNFLAGEISKENEVTLRLYKLHLQLTALRSFHKIPPILIEEIGLLSEIIGAMEDCPDKYFLKLWNLENLSELTGLIRLNNINEITVSEKLGSPIPLDARHQAAVMIVRMQQLFAKEINSIDEYAKHSKNSLLKAFSILAKSRAKVSLEIDLISAGTDPKSLEDHAKWLAYNMNLAAEGFQIFIDHNQLNQAYILLCISAELHIIATQWGNWESPIIEDQLKNNFEILERELEIAPFQSKVIHIIRSKSKISTENSAPNSGMRGILNLDDQQIENAVDMAINTGQFPNARKEFMILEMLSFRLFFQRCEDADIYPIVADPTSKENAYSFQLRHQLVNKRTGLVSLISSDMDSLLQAWGY